VSSALYFWDNQTPLQISVATPTAPLGTALVRLATAYLLSRMGQDNSWKYPYLISRMLGWAQKFQLVWSPESQNLTCLRSKVTF